jgi:hypothetical protein
MANNNIGQINKNKRDANLKELENIIVGLQQMGEDITIKKLVEYTGKSRQYFYRPYVKDLLEKYSIKKKEKKIISKEYLLNRIREFEVDKTILQEKINKLEYELNESRQREDELLKELGSKERRFVEFNIKYYQLIKKYEGLEINSNKNNNNYRYETFDLLEEEDGLRKLISNEINMLLNQNKSKVIDLKQESKK